MPPAFDRDLQAMLPPEAYGVLHVGDTQTPGYESGTPLDRPVVDLAGLFIALISFAQQVASQSTTERRHGSFVDF